MNSSPLAARNETPKIKRTADAKQLGLGPVPAPKPRPTIALLREALTALHVHGTARALAFELLSYWQPGGAVFPSLRTLSVGLGIDPRTVRAHLARLDRVGLWVRVGRTGRTNLYQLRLPGPEPRILGSPPPGSQDPPEVTKGRDVQPPQAKLAVSTETPELPGHLESVGGGHGLRCRRCDHSWPAVTGRAHLCVGRRTEQPSRPKRTRGGPLNVYDGSVRRGLPRPKAAREGSGNVRGDITALIGPTRRRTAVFPQYFEPFAWAGLSLTGTSVGLSRVGTGESGSMTKKRNCATARRIANLRLLGRLADEVLRPAAADRVLSMIGDELLSLGIHPWLAESVDTETTIH